MVVPAVKVVIVTIVAPSNVGTPTPGSDKCLQAGLLTYTALVLYRCGFSTLTFE